MNDLKKTGTQNFMGIEIPVIEGGFGEDCRVLTANTIAEIHNSRLDKVNELILNNIDEFEDGIDIIDLIQNEKSLNLAKGLGLITNNRQKHCYILSEQGYMLFVGFMRSEKAKEIRKQLRREYFTMRQVINSSKQLKASYLLSIYNGGEDAVLASKKLSEIEIKEVLEPLQPKLEYHDAVLNKEGLITTTVIAKDLGMTSAVKLNNILHRNRVIFKDKSGTWHPYAKYQWLIEWGYADYQSYDNEYATLSLKWTEKGRKWIIENIKNWL